MRKRIFLVHPYLPTMPPIDAAFVLGQISMVPARAHLSPAMARRVIASPDAAVARMRALVGS